MLAKSRFSVQKPTLETILAQGVKSGMVLYPMFVHYRHSHLDGNRAESLVRKNVCLPLNKKTGGRTRIEGVKRE